MFRYTSMSLGTEEGRELSGAGIVPRILGRGWTSSQGYY